VTPTTPENCRAMAADCDRLAQQHIRAGLHGLAGRAIDRARELTILALKLEQDSILSNSVPASSQALTDKPGSDPPSAVRHKFRGDAMSAEFIGRAAIAHIEQSRRIAA
jgi:hypothetical protein